MFKIKSTLVLLAISISLFAAEDDVDKEFQVNFQNLLNFVKEMYLLQQQTQYNNESSKGNKIPPQSQKMENSNKVTSNNVKVNFKSCIDTLPHRYFIGIFIGDYYFLPKLGYIYNDVQLVKNLVRCYLGIKPKNSLILVDPTLAEVKIKLKKFVEKIKGRDALTIVYYSGHGMVDNFGNFYLLPRDAYVESITDLRETGLPLGYLKSKLRNSPGYKVIMVDACRLKTEEKGFAVAGFGVKEDNLAVIFSTTEGQTSTASRDRQYSAFTYALYKTLQVKNYLDFDNSGYVEIKELLKPLQKNLKNISVNNRQKIEVKGDVNIPLVPVD
jgi:hypothetical protein